MSRATAFLVAVLTAAVAGCGQRLGDVRGAEVSAVPASAARPAASSDPAAGNGADRAGPAPAGAPAAGGGGANAAAAAGSVAEKLAPPPEDPRWALVVGIDDYAGTEHDLTSAVADARTMVRTLRAIGVPRDHMRVLTDGDATTEAIAGGLRWLAERTGPGKLGVFLFAGHAVQMDGDHDGDGEAVDEVLVGSDLRYVTDGEVAEALRPARGEMWLLFAACHAAGFSDAAAPGRVLSYASGEDDDAFESRSLGGSFLVEFVVRRAILLGGAVAAEDAHRAGAQAMTGGWASYRPRLEDRHPGPLILAR